MSEQFEVDTTYLKLAIDRLQKGDAAAENDLLRRIEGRLETLARRMLRRFPRVRYWEQTGDVLQAALFRLSRALQTLRPDSTRAFFGLASEQIRRELLDLARHYNGPAKVNAYQMPINQSGDSAPTPDRPAPDAPADLARWQAFHETVARLPQERREVFNLLYYHGWSRGEAAAFLGICERTVRRRWLRACLQVSRELQGEVPSA